MNREMKAGIILVAVLCLAPVLAGQASALDRTEYVALCDQKESARLDEVDVFAPKAWEKTNNAFGDLRDAVTKGKGQEKVDKLVAEVQELLENAKKSTDVGKLSLKEYLPVREKAKEAGAPSLVPEVYQEAHEQFMKATEKVESGDVKGGLKVAEAAVPLFDRAELEAIRVDVLEEADRLIAQAVVDEAESFAPSTLDKARTARERANAVLTRDRYNKEDAGKEAARSGFEARHASNIAKSVRSLKRNDQAWEKLILVYEIQMNRTGAALGFDTLPFDTGPGDVTDLLIERIEGLYDVGEKLRGRLDKMTQRLIQMLDRFDAAASAQDPLGLVEAVDLRIAELLASKAELTEQLEAKRIELADLTREHAEVSDVLDARVERENLFTEAKKILLPSDGEMLFNASNDIVLRLSGLSFASGKSDIVDEHVPLLEKVETIIGMLPGTRIVVEGHTDSLGKPDANIRLSEKRAYAVMQYLRTNLEIPADRIQSIGYGSEKPVASNQTKEGRAKNRRIDIVIMQ